MKDAVNIAAAEPVGWGSSMPKLKNVMPPIRNGKKDNVTSSSGEQERGKVPVRWVPELHPHPTGAACLGTRPPQGEREIIRENNMCPFCLRHGADLDCSGRGTDRKPVYATAPVSRINA